MQRVPIKNFGNDIRASSDVEHFVKQAKLFLDLDETNLEAILDTMLERLIDEDEPNVTIHEAKMDLFTNDNGAFRAKQPATDSTTATSSSTNNKTTTYFTYGGRMGIVALKDIGFRMGRVLLVPHVSVQHFTRTFVFCLYFVTLSHAQIFNQTTLFTSLFIQYFSQIQRKH